MIKLREGSVAAEALADGRAAEIGGFAALEGISRTELIDAVDALVGALTELARRREIAWLWIFPRAAFMSLLRAEISPVLPPYHFTLSPDIVGWLPGSTQLEAFRAMRLRGFLDIPLMYQITTDEFADDLDGRMVQYDQRAQVLSEGNGSRLTRAMISAERTLREEITFIYPQARHTPLGVPPVHVSSPLASASRVRMAASASEPVEDERDFLPAGFSDNLPLASYLRQVLQSGGAPAEAYKQLSYSMLDIEPGHRILDVGCGAGVDLPALAHHAGLRGAVVGMDINPELVREARRATAQHVSNQSATVLVLQGDAEHMTIPNEEFDRVRTDRALQHVPRPLRALNEIWRVLKPGGILTLVEPDWGSIVAAPGSAADEDDGMLTKTLDWCRRHLAHPLMGRSLKGLLSHMPADAWRSINVVVAPFVFSDWSSMDAVLLLSRAAAALQQESPELAGEVSAWLRAVEEASTEGSFFGYIPMFFAVAVKSAPGE
jgi:ubiquinone/menaquinone biosynthesis C-methylase UbiE